MISLERELGSTCKPRRRYLNWEVGKGRHGNYLTQEESLQKVVGEKTKNSNQILEEKRGKHYWNYTLESKSYNLSAFISQNGAWDNKCLNKWMRYWHLLRARCSLCLIILQILLLLSSQYFHKVGIYFPYRRRMKNSKGREVIWLT